MRGAWRGLLATGCLLAGTLPASVGALAQGTVAPSTGEVGASAQEGSTPAQLPPVLVLRAGAGVTWDSNPFLLSNGVDPKAQLGTSDKSDTVTSAFVGIGIDKRYSLQRFYLEATETAHRHRNFSFLDFNAFQYRGGWDWRVGTRLSGTLSADRSQALVNYGDFRNTALRNLVTTEHRLASLDGWILGPIGHRDYPKVPQAINPHPILRKHFDLFANVRPTRSYPGIGCLHDDIDLVIVRENNEGFQPDRNMLAGSGEFQPDEDHACAEAAVASAG